MEKETEGKRENGQRDMKEIERLHAESQAKIMELQKGQPVELMGLEEWLKKYDMAREFNYLSKKRTQVATFFNCYVGLETLKTLREIKKTLDILNKQENRQDEKASEKVAPKKEPEDSAPAPRKRG